MNYVLIFVVNFHSQFVTKVDRAYNVRCFYSQQEKTVTSQLEVSMIATQNLEAGTMIMPNCEYSIRSDTLNGPRIRYINIGDRLVHRWECDNRKLLKNFSGKSYTNYGMLVKNCFVNDGLGFSVRVLDGRG
uniref:ZP domain-containing protein n=1 Tax=Romanomermis culicivorax TaxID=13658 RepID=A0A915K7X8_ROMCU